MASEDPVARIGFSLKPEPSGRRAYLCFKTCYLREVPEI